MSPTLETWHRHADSAELDLLIGNSFHFAEHPNESNAPRVLLDRQPWDEVISGVDWIIRAVTAREWPHRAWLQLVNSKLVRRLGARFIEGMGHQDIPWTMQLALAARRVGFVRDPLYGYRMNLASVMNDPSKAAVLRAGSQLHPRDSTYRCNRKSYPTRIACA